MTGSVAPNSAQAPDAMASVSAVPHGPTGLWAALAVATARPAPPRYQNTDELLAQGAHLSYLARLGPDGAPPAPVVEAPPTRGEAEVVSLAAFRARRGR